MCGTAAQTAIAEQRAPGGLVPKRRFCKRGTGARTMSRRGKGEGSIYFNDKLNLWCAAITVSATGRRQRRIAYGHGRREAADKLKALLERADTTPSSETVAAYLTRWLRIIQPSVKPRSHAKFEQVIRLHVIPAIGNLKLDKLSALQVQEFI